MDKFKYSISLIIKPIKDYFYFFITLLLLHSIIDIAYFNVWKAQSLGVVCHGLVISYLLTIPCLWLNKNRKLFTIYKYIIFSLYTISFWIDIISHAVVGSSLNINTVSAILATNKNEALEAIQTYFSITPFIIGSILLIMIFYVYKLLKRYRIQHSIFYVIWILGIGSGLFIALFSPQVNACGPLAHMGGPFGKMYLFYSCSKPIDLEAHLNKKVDITVDNQNQPQNIVLIIGESLTRHHCSTYGYEKKTCPLLEKLEQDSSLYTFTDVKSPEVYTLPTFKKLFYKNRTTKKDSVEWYQTPSLLDIISKSGYKTYWISNQSKAGLLDNVIGQFANFCTENHFVQTVGQHITYDGEVIKFIQPIVEKKNDKNFYVVHFMGSHTLFNQRFPSNRNKFCADDYLNRPVNQRQVIADYDNSVLYNDSVVNEIFKTFRNEEAIIFYFPDHGVDLFQTSSDYYGHANSSKESIHFGKEIPFYIYVTSKYKKNYPDRINIINQNKKLPFCTDRMFYTIMDLMGTSFKDNHEVQDSTLFSVESVSPNKILQ